MVIVATITAWSVSKHFWHKHELIVNEHAKLDGEMTVRFQLYTKNCRQRSKDGSTEAVLPREEQSTRLSNQTTSPENSAYK